MSKCNVLFIVPPNLPLHNLLKHVEGDNPGANLGTTRSMPMGVLSIAGYVAKHADVNFEVLDLNLEVVELLGSGGTLNWDKFLNYHLKERYNKNFDILSEQFIDRVTKLKFYGRPEFSNFTNDNKSEIEPTPPEAITGISVISN